MPKSALPLLLYYPATLPDFIGAVAVCLTHFQRVSLYLFPPTSSLSAQTSATFGVFRCMRSEPAPQIAFLKHQPYYGFYLWQKDLLFLRRKILGQIGFQRTIH